MHKAAYLIRPNEYLKIDEEYKRVVAVSPDCMIIPESADMVEFLEAKSNHIKIWLAPFQRDQYLEVDRMHLFVVLEKHPLVSDEGHSILGFKTLNM